MKTSELTGAALDWAVARIENPYLQVDHFLALHGSYRRNHDYTYSGYWEWGGPIIERELLALRQITLAQELVWVASAYLVKRHGYGPTPLIAAMRCFVASKLGDEVDVPEELT